MTQADRRVVAAWLFCCAALVFAIVVVGGVTRLTHSGLSIVEWQPLVGALPIGKLDSAFIFESAYEELLPNLRGRKPGALGRGVGDDSKNLDARNLLASGDILPDP